MIRTILAVLITVAIVAIGLPMFQDAADDRGDGEARAAAADVEEAAKSLYAAEDLPPRGVEGPQRTLTVTFPRDGLTVDPVQSFVVENATGNVSLIRYRIHGRQEQVVTVEAPLVGPQYGTVDFGSLRGEQEFVLTLQRHPDTGDPVVVIERL